MQEVVWCHSRVERLELLAWNDFVEVRSEVGRQRHAEHLPHPVQKRADGALQQAQ